MVLTKQPLLVVEDCDEDFETIDRVIRRKGVEVMRAKTGDQGLALLRAPDLRGRALVVLLDLNTPGTDGRQVLREIKSDAGLKLVPVIVFTTSANPEDIKHCYLNGANSYHLKPLELRRFEETVSSIANYWVDRVVLYRQE